MELQKTWFSRYINQWRFVCSWLGVYNMTPANRWLISKRDLTNQHSHSSWLITKETTRQGVMAFGPKITAYKWKKTNQLDVKNDPPIRGLCFMPNWSISAVNLLFVSDFVRQSAVMSSVLQCFNLMTSSLTNSCIWWYWMLMCLIQVWNSKFLTRASELMLSLISHMIFECWLSMTVTGSLIMSCILSLYKNFCIYTVILSVFDKSMYSVSVIDIAVVLCFQLYQINTPSLHRKAASLIKHQSHLLSPKTESEYSIRSPLL